MEAVHANAFPEVSDAPNRASKPRGKPSDEGRFLWLSSYAVECIVNRLGMTQAAYGIAVYVALCRLSSKAKNNPRIQASISEIAGGARLGYRKTMEVLHELASDRIKVIAIEEQRAPGRRTQEESFYTLLATRRHGRKSVSDFPEGSQADFPGRTPSGAEIPKEHPIKGVEKIEAMLASAGSVLSHVPPAGTASKKNVWNGRCDL